MKEYSITRIMCIAWSVVFGTTGASPAIADDGDQKVEMLHRLIEAEQKMFSDIRTIEYKCTATTISADGDPIKTETLHYIESPKGIRWDRTTDPGASRGFEREIVAWNRKQTMTFDSLSGMMYVQASAPNAGLPGFLPRGPLEYLRFLRSEPANSIASTPRSDLERIASSDAWRELAAGSKVIKMDSSGAAVVEVAGGEIKGFVAGPTTFQVQLPKELGRAPIGWRRNWINGDVALVYSVVDWQTITLDEPGKKWRYPAHAKIECIDPKRNTTRFTIIIKTEEVKVNHSIDEDEFTVDPAMAETLYDLDEGSIINVAR